jgi:hypothetical protein
LTFTRRKDRANFDIWYISAINQPKPFRESGESIEGETKRGLVVEVSSFTIKKNGYQKKCVRNRITLLKETQFLTGIYSWDH